MDGPDAARAVRFTGAAGRRRARDAVLGHAAAAPGRMVWLVRRRMVSAALPAAAHARRRIGGGAGSEVPVPNKGAARGAATVGERRNAAHGLGPRGLAGSRGVDVWDDGPPAGRRR